jgi:hypothetical protein
MIFTGEDLLQKALHRRGWGRGCILNHVGTDDLDHCLVRVELEQEMEGQLLCVEPKRVGEWEREREWEWDDLDMERDREWDELS